MPDSPLTRTERVIAAAAALLVLLAMPGPSFAREWEVSIAQALRGESNVLRSAQDRISDASYEVLPRITLREEGERLSYEARYQPSYEAFFQNDGTHRDIKP